MLNFEIKPLYHSGLMLEDHGDHFHPYIESVEKMAFSLNYPRPIHYQTNGQQSAIFFDGQGEKGNLHLLDIDNHYTPIANFPVLNHELSDHGHGGPKLITNANNPEFVYMIDEKNQQIIVINIKN